MPVGYSGRALIDKLGIKPGTKVTLLGAPAGYLDVLGELPEGARITRALRQGALFVHCFVRTRFELLRRLPPLLGALPPDGTLWLSWPKKSSPLAGDLTEDVLRTVALPAGLVDIKVCAIDDDWSGLKLVWRKSARSAGRAAR